MGKKYKNLKDAICSWDNLLLAYEKTSRGKRSSRSYLEFREYDLLNLEKIQQQLMDETYVMDPSYEFDIYEPKLRHIKALSFRDRVVQHALCNIIEPIFDKTFVSCSYACRKGKGTHSGVKYVQSILRKHSDDVSFLKTDFSKFFPSIEYDLLFEAIKKKITCSFTLGLIRVMLPEGGKGLPVGWLISQLSANIFGSILDQFLQHELKLKNWARYMDDIVVIHEDQDALKSVKNAIESFSLNELKLSISKWHIQKATKGINFLGYRIWKTHKLIRRDSMLRARRKVAKYDGIQLNKFIASWRGHIKWADCHNLTRKLKHENF